MLKTTSEPPEYLQTFRLDPWPFQATYRTPLKDLRRFVTTLITPFLPEMCALTTDGVIFEPRTVLELLANNSVRLEDVDQFSLEAEGRHDIEKLLESALSDWIDFLFVASPPSFAVYADHDEYDTINCPSMDRIESIAKVLDTAGYQRVTNFKRVLDTR